MHNSAVAAMLVAKAGTTIQIQAQGTCETLERICIAPEGSNALCYEYSSIRLQEMGYTRNSCKDSQQLLCFEATVNLAMNNTLYNVFCSSRLCGNSSTFRVGATSKLIVPG